MPLRKWLTAQQMELASYLQGEADYELPYSFEHWKKQLKLPNKEELGLLLEVGCGAYGVSYFIDDSIGIDPLVGQYENKFHAAGTLFVKAVSEHLPIKKSSIDSVVICNVLDHCENDEEVLAEIQRATKVGGKIYFYSFIYKHTWLLNLLDPHHPNHYTKDRVEELLQGLDIRILMRQNTSIFWILTHLLKKWKLRQATRIAASIFLFGGRGYLIHLKV